MKIAIYDLTDCEGCEIQILSLREKLLALEKRVEIVDWRLAQEKKLSGPIDLAIVEGSPITSHEKTFLKKLRRRAKFLMALGACASLGGIPAIVGQEDYKQLMKKIYGPHYRSRSTAALPLSAYVKVDFALHGCPAPRRLIERVITDFLAGKKPGHNVYPVCLECKEHLNNCRLLEQKPCLGPVTQGGCGAICVTGGSTCWGCLGPIKDANLPAMLRILNGFLSPAEIKRFFSMFWKATAEYEKIFENTKKK